MLQSLSSEWIAHIALIVSRKVSVARRKTTVTSAGNLVRGLSSAITPFFSWSCSSCWSVTVCLPYHPFPSWQVSSVQGVRRRWRRRRWWRKTSHSPQVGYDISFVLFRFQLSIILFLVWLPILKFPDEFDPAKGHGNELSNVRVEWRHWACVIYCGLFFVSDCWYYGFYFFPCFFGPSSGRWCAQCTCVWIYCFEYCLNSGWTRWCNSSSAGRYQLGMLIATGLCVNK